MNGDRAILEKTVSHALSGKDAHVEALSALEGLDWKLAGIRPDGVEHSVFQLLNHMIYWQDWVVKWLDEADPPIPEHASGSWPCPAAPADEDDWKRTLDRFAALLDELARHSGKGRLFSTRVLAGAEKSHLEMLRTIGSHNSYHIGQVVFLRQMLGAWPPPSGGITW